MNEGKQYVLQLYFIKLLKIELFLSELFSKSKEAIRQEMKKLADEGKIECLYNDVYYLSYKTILDTKEKMIFDKFLKKYLDNNGKISSYVIKICMALKHKIQFIMKYVQMKL